MNYSISLKACINSSDDVTVSCKNLVNFHPATLEFKTVQCGIFQTSGPKMTDHTKSQNVLNQSSPNFRVGRHIDADDIYLGMLLW